MSVEQRIEVLREARRDAGAALHLAKRKMKEGFERGRKKAHQFKVGDYINEPGKWLGLKLCILRVFCYS